MSFSKGIETLYLLELFALLLLVSYSAGLLGALTGLGGGVVLVPALVLLFHVDIHYAMGASLIAVIATSSGTAAAFLRDGYTNLRIGMLLEVAAVLGAIIGAYAVRIMPVSIIAIVFGLVLLSSAYLSLRRHEAAEPLTTSDHFAARLQLAASYGDTGHGHKRYEVTGVGAGLGLMAVAGVLSGLLGIGSGAVKVLAMDQAMRLPYKVSTATSNFMIGITAAASVGVYFSRGYVDPALTLPVMLGVLAGSLTGAVAMKGARVRSLRLLFALVIVAMGIEMIWSGLSGSIGGPVSGH